VATTEDADVAEGTTVVTTTAEETVAAETVTAETAAQAATAEGTEGNLSHALRSYAVSPSSGLTGGSSLDISSILQA
jgi:hypothetical protein